MSIHIQKESFVITASINRPDSQNAINFEVMEKLENLLDEIKSDQQIRLFILTGTGKSFISGGDLKEFHQITDAEGARQMSQRMISVLGRIESLPCWTLAAVNGYAYGGGWETLLSFDFRVAKASAKFGFTQGKFYLPPGWGGLTRLRETAGKERADYWLASQQVIDTETALRSGLIQDAFPDDQYETSLQDLIKKLTLNDRHYIEYMKKSDHQKITDEMEPFSRFWESKEHQLRVEKFLKRNT